MSASNQALKPLIATTEEVSPITPFGLHMQVLLTTEATGGAISVIMVAHQPGEGPPDHFHSAQEECIFIVDGTYEIKVDGVARIAGAGTLIFLPRGTIHSFRNIGTVVGHMLDWSIPGGQDHYFKAISDLAAGGGFSAGKVLELSKQYDTHFPSGDRDPR